MIVTSRTASVAPGKNHAAMLFAHQVTKYVTEKYGVETTLMVPIGGDAMRISWRGQFPSLADLEAYGEKLRHDREYSQMVDKAGDCFIAGSVHDEMWRTV